MLFSSNIFLWFFLPVTIVVNSLLKTKWSNYFLLAVSLLFYAWGEPVYVIIMLVSICINWSFGMLLDKATRSRKLILAICIGINLAILGYYKYYNFLSDIINSVVGFEAIEAREIALPIGISFFTFQALSYVIDFYRGNCKVQKNILNLSLYVSFFPQLIAGPIVRYSDVDEQISNRTVSKERFAKGLRRFLYGLGKKIIISNAMAELADFIFAISFENLTTVPAWIGAIAYTLQIYFDFSGYSDMAIGLGHIFGFHFLENFTYPYLSRSIQEFWQRWHISLGTWFKEYVYIPLGGNRKGKFRTYLNLITVFFLTGMWHGASWNFVFWGLYQGFFQILERLGLKKYLSKSSIISRLYCLIVVVFGWVMFRSNTLYDSIQYMLHMIAPWQYGFADMTTILPVFNMHKVTLMIIAILGGGLLQNICNKIPQLAEKWKYSMLELVYLCVICIYCFVLLAAGTYNPFIYFRF